jgi:hypothetical protein
LIEGSGHPFLARVHRQPPANEGSLERYKEVDDHFCEVIKPVLGKFGYRTIDLGVEPQESAWMNEEIFPACTARRSYFAT